MTDTIWVHLIETQGAGDMAASERKFGSDSLATRDSSCRILHKIAHAKRAYQYHVREGFNLRCQSVRPVQFRDDLFCRMVLETVGMHAVKLTYIFAGLELDWLEIRRIIPQ